MSHLALPLVIYIPFQLIYSEVRFITQRININMRNDTIQVFHLNRLSVCVN